MRHAIVILLLAIGACSSTTDIDDKWSNPETIQYASSLHVDLQQMHKSATGLYWQDIVVGDADSAKVGDNVRVHFTGWLPDGTQFDSTRDREPIEFFVGVGLVLRGFDEGVIGMRIGGTRRLVIPPALAFGVRGRPAEGIPPATTVIVDVERLTTPAH